ncbi:choice-of-anchor G family protein, partial [Arthrobacter pigmenti]
MEKEESNSSGVHTGRVRKRLRRWLAAGVVSALSVSAYGLPAAADVHQYPDEPAESAASIINSSILGNELLGGGLSEAASETNPGPNNGALDVGLLGSEVISIGNIQVPVTDIIDFGELGVLLSESEASGPRDARAITGVAGADGSITLDGAEGNFGAARLDLLSLFQEAGVDGLTDLAVDEATMLLGVGGAEVIAQDGQFLDPDGVGGPGQYRVAEASVLLSSPVIEQVAGMLYDAVGQIDVTMEEQVNGLLDLTSITEALPAGATLDATVTSNMQEEIFQEILAQPITTKNKVLTVDFSTGTATLHLDQLVSGDLRPGQPAGLNAQNPNTELIADELYPMIAETVHDLVEEVTSTAVSAIEGALGSVTIDFTAGLDAGIASAEASWTVNLMGDMSEVTCTSSGIGGGAACATLETAINTVVAPMINTVVTPIRDFILSDGGQQVFEVLINDIKTGLITVPIRNVLEPFIDTLAQVISVQLNRQVTTTCVAPDGTEMIDSLEVSALSIGLIQSADAARINLGTAGARVDACNLAASELGLTVDPTEVEAGDTTTVDGTGFTPNSGVTVDILDSEGNVVDTVTATSDDAGSFTVDYPTAADMPAGEYTVLATDDVTGEQISASVVVLENGGLNLNLGVDPPAAAPGETTTVTGEGYTPNAEVTVELVDADGNVIA